MTEPCYVHEKWLPEYMAGRFKAGHALKQVDSCLRSCLWETLSS